MKLLNKRLFYIRKSGRNRRNLKEKMKMTVDEKQNAEDALEKKVYSNYSEDLEKMEPTKLLSKIDDLAPSLVSLTNESYLLREHSSSMSDDDVDSSLSSECDEIENRRKARKAVCILCIMTIVGNESHVVSLVKEHRILIPLLNALDDHWWAVNCDGCYFADGKDSNNGNEDGKEEKKEDDDCSTDGSSSSKPLPWSSRLDFRRRLEKEQKLLCLIFEAIERILQVFLYPSNGCLFVDHSTRVRDLLSYTTLESSSSSSSRMTSFTDSQEGCKSSRRNISDLEGRAKKVLQAIFNLNNKNNTKNNDS